MTRLPPPTEAELRAAFELMAWKGCTFESAMRDDIRSRVVKACAAKKRKDEFLRSTTRRVRLVKRCHPVTHAWVTQRVPGDFDVTQPLIF